MQYSCPLSVLEDTNDLREKRNIIQSNVLVYNEGDSQSTINLIQSTQHNTTEYMYMVFVTHFTKSV